MRIALEGENWNITLFGKNITNAEVLTYVGNNPLSGSSFGTDTFLWVCRPTRCIWQTVRLKLLVNAKFTSHYFKN